MATLYERIGGEAAVHAAATRLYDKALGDPRVTRFFAGLDMDALIRKQVAFLSWAFGAPQRFSYRPLGEAHANLVRAHGLSHSHFEVVLEHLQEALEELKVPAELIEEVMQTVATTRDQVLRGS